LIATIERILGGGLAPGVVLGIGDDAAVLRASGRLVWTIDAAVEGVHFDLDLLSPADIGFRSFQAAASDLAAMGARPLAALSNLSLPERVSTRDVERLVKGQAEAARALSCPIIGGNLSRASELSITTAVLGTVKRPLLRSTARPGDELWLLGDVGLARAGLMSLLAKKKRRSRALARCVRAFARPKALLDAGVALSGRARAAVDVSDGLAGDAGHIARASAVRVVIEADALLSALSPELLRAAVELGREPLELALFGGEDYALLATGPRRKKPTAAAPIGRIERGRGVMLESAGRTRRLAGGFDHFSG
jgi:thiamine-monophosphate kinase